MLDHLWLPEGISTYSPRIDFLFTLIFWIVVVVWVLVMIAMIVFMVRYRTKPGRKATYIEGNSRLEVLWTTATAVILIALALLSRSTWANIKEHGPPGDVFYQGHSQAIQLGNHLSGSRRQAGHARRRDSGKRLSCAGQQGGAVRPDLEGRYP